MISAESIGESNILTTRQLDVACRMIRGERNKEIGKFLNVQEKTIKWHLTTVYRLASCERRAEFIAKYYNQKLPVRIQRQLEARLRGVGTQPKPKPNNGELTPGRTEGL